MIGDGTRNRNGQGWAVLMPCQWLAHPQHGDLRPFRGLRRLGGKSPSGVAIVDAVLTVGFSDAYVQNATFRFHPSSEGNRSSIKGPTVTSTVTVMATIKYRLGLKTTLPQTWLWEMINIRRGRRQRRGKKGRGVYLTSLSPRQRAGGHPQIPKYPGLER